MGSPSAEEIADIILGRRQVYSLDADTLIRQAANQLTARALFEVIEHLDADSRDLAARVSTLVNEISGGELTHCIGFHTGKIPTGDSEAGAPKEPEKPTEYYLRLVFCNEDAAYYQFPLFPNLEADYVLGATRKRAGAVQHLRVDLASPEALQWFIESCRSNPHFVRVEESSAEEFERARSDSM